MFILNEENPDQFSKYLKEALYSRKGLLEPMNIVNKKVGYRSVVPQNEMKYFMILDIFRTASTFLRVQSNTQVK